MTKSMDIAEQNLLDYLTSITKSPLNIIIFIIDIALVIFLAVKLFKLVKETRVWQLLKGILILILITILSDLLNLRILNYILTSVMTYGVLLLIVIC